MLYYETFKELLNVWSNQASIKNTSYEQHFYLTKCIIVCSSFFEAKDKDIIGPGLKNLFKKKILFISKFY